MHTLLQQPASFSFSQVWRFHVGLGQCVGVQECSFVVKYHELSSSSSLHSRCNSADHVSHESQRWCPCEETVRPSLLISRATNRLRTSTRSLSPLLMSLHRALLHGLGTCRTTPFFPHVLWPRHLQRASLLSLRQCNLPRNRSRLRLKDIRRARCTRQVRTPCRHHRRLARRFHPNCSKLCRSLFVSGFRHCRSSLHVWVHHRNVSGQRCKVGINFHASVLQTPRIPRYFQEHITVRAFFLASPPNAAARHHCCTVAQDVFLRPRIETEPATVQPVLSEFLLWSRGLVWLEKDLLTEGCNLLIERFVSDALVCCRHGTFSTSRVHVATATSRLNCRDPSLHQSVVQCSP